jgi:signal transduction histidine kinase
MPEAWISRNHGAVSSAVSPTLYRRPDLGHAGGVVSGIAQHTGLRWRTVAVVFAILTVSGGLGLALYLAYWIILPTAPGIPRRSLPRIFRLSPRISEVIFGTALAAVLIVVIILRLPTGGLVLPSLLVVVGGAFVWRQALDEIQLRERNARSLEPAAPRSRTRFVVGAVLVVSGAALVLHGADFTAIRDGLLAMLVTVIGIAVITGPWWVGLVTQLSAERRERIRSQEREEIAAHLHDSVLQTLALIQRNADSPREVVRLARGQERDLRDLLYGTRSTSGRFADTLRAAAAEVEDAYAVSIDVVAVGDCELDDELTAVCFAAREAMVNAAKHAGVSEVTVYAELEDDAASVFIRDRGVGFDPTTVEGDRHGVRDSIVSRVERHGGTADIRSDATGTDVHLRMPR